MLCIKRDVLSFVSTTTILQLNQPSRVNINLHNHNPPTFNSLIIKKMSSPTASSSSLPDSICANCGKGEESSGDLKACTACKLLVKYCNRDCQIAHRPQHKKVCRKRAAELYDEALFQERPREEECPICMLPPPIYENDTGMTFHSCCGKHICNGCGDKTRQPLSIL